MTPWGAQSTGPATGDRAGVGAQGSPEGLGVWPGAAGAAGGFGLRVSARSRRPPQGTPPPPCTNRAPGLWHKITNRQSVNLEDDSCHRTRSLRGPLQVQWRFFGIGTFSPTQRGGRGSLFTETRFFGSRGSIPPSPSPGSPPRLGVSGWAAFRRNPENGQNANCRIESIRAFTAEFPHFPVYVKIFIINWAGAGGRGMGGAICCNSIDFPWIFHKTTFPKSGEHLNPCLKVYRSELIFKKKKVKGSTRASCNPTAYSLRRLGNTRLQKSPTAQTPQGRPRPFLLPAPRSVARSQAHAPTQQARSVTSRAASRARVQRPRRRLRARACGPAGSVPRELGDEDPLLRRLRRQGPRWSRTPEGGGGRRSASGADGDVIRAHRKRPQDEG